MLQLREAQTNHLKTCAVPTGINREDQHTQQALRNAPPG
jgi:hypothetical protein